MLSDLIVQKPTQPPTSAIIMLHGYGANGRDLLDMAPYFGKTLTDSIFYAPNAPVQMGEDAFSWFPIDSLDVENKYESFAFLVEMMTRAKGVLPIVNTFIDHIAQKHNLTNDRISIMGFSQGGLMALLAGLTRTPQMNSIIACSNIPLLAMDLDIAAKPDVLITHGTHDDRVPYEGMGLTAAGLRQLGIDVQTYTVPDMAHDIDLSCMKQMRAFWEKHF